MLELTLAARGHKPKVVGVASFKDATKTWNNFRDSNMLGASDLVQRSGILKKDGKKIGYVSYNGKIWDLQENEIIG